MSNVACFIVRSDHGRSPLFGGKIKLELKATATSRTAVRSKAGSAGCHETACQPRVQTRSGERLIH
jgi:hypothetical protein